MVEVRFHDCKTLSVRAACEMLTDAVKSAPLTVTVASRVMTDVLAVAVTLTVALPFPEAGDTVHHDASLLTVHPALVVTVKVFCSPATAKLSDVGETDRLVDGAAVCVTLIVFAATPVPLMVTVAVRCVVEVFATAATVTVPLLFPEAGDTVHHAALLLTVQLVFDVIVKVFCSFEAEKLREFDETDKVRDGAAGA